MMMACGLWLITAGPRACIGVAAAPSRWRLPVNAPLVNAFGAGCVGAGSGARCSCGFPHVRKHQALVVAIAVVSITKWKREASRYILILTRVPKIYSPHMRRRRIASHRAGRIFLLSTPPAGELGEDEEEERPAAGVVAGDGGL